MYAFQIRLGFDLVNSSNSLSQFELDYLLGVGTVLLVDADGDAQEVCVCVCLFV